MEAGAEEQVAGILHEPLPAHAKAELATEVVAARLVWARVARWEAHAADG
jgi:hypothetical protein